jgi:DNA topoisomerase-1
MWKHVSFKPKRQVEIKFIGKKGVLNQAICDDGRIYRILKVMSRDAESDDDFVFSVKASHVNEYIKKYDDKLTTKDIRTWQANLLFIKFFEEADKELNVKKKQLYALKKVATFLHNTPAVCKSNYIHPKLLA